MTTQEEILAAAIKEWLERFARNIEKKAAQAERERCAKVCDEWEYGETCARKIRALED